MFAETRWQASREIRVNLTNLATNIRKKSQQAHGISGKLHFMPVAGRFLSRRQAIWGLAPSLAPSLRDGSHGLLYRSPGRAETIFFLLLRCCRSLPHPVADVYGTSRSLARDGFPCLCCGLMSFFFVRCSLQHLLGGLLKFCYSTFAGRCR